jgi:esterase
MKLNFKKTGEGKPLMILHGLFGLSDNWATLSKQYAENGFACYTIDARNHGRSPHSFDFNYKIMSDDLADLMTVEQINEADLIGHSMGAKTVMFFSEYYPEKIRRMVLADMAPRYYPPHHQSIFAALHSVNVSTISSRREAEEKLRLALKSESTIQFLLKNLYRVDDEKYAWRFGLDEIEKNIEAIGIAFSPASKIDIPTLFLRGERSGYITNDDIAEIKSIFTNVQVEMIPDAGHWVHAENPVSFLAKTLEFLM